MAEESLIVRISNLVTKYSIFALIFLTPVFFLPWTTDVLDFNKQSLLAVLVFLSVFAFMLKILASGKLGIRKSAMHIVAGVLFLAYLLSTIFSVFARGSFWGQPQQSSESLIVLLCLVFLYLLVSNVFSKKDILLSVIILSLSAVVAELIGVFQLFGVFIFPFDFTRSVAFNTVGSGGSLGIFTAILLPLAIIMFIAVKKWWRVLFVLQIIFSAAVLFLIDYNSIWSVVIAGMLVLVLMMIKKKLFDGRWMILPIFFITVSLFFVILNPQIRGVTQKVNEVFLSQKADFSISAQAIKERPILGSGPGTFGYDFSKFKNADFSKSSLWNVVFNRPSSQIINSLATTGVLGFLALLAFMAFPLFYGWRFLIAENTSGGENADEEMQKFLLSGLFAVLAGGTVAVFVYSFNISLYFIYFFTIAALVGLIFNNKKEYNLAPSSLFTLMVAFAFTLIFIFGVGILALSGQRYLAEVDYYKGLADYQAGQKDSGLKKLESAVSMNPSSDMYLRQLSQAYILSLQDEASAGKTAPTDEEKTKVQTLVSNSVNAAKIATDINPNDANNWSFRGYVYQNLLSILSDASTWAITSYDSALKLDPNNPYLFAQEGNVYLAQALSSASDQGQKTQFLSQAKDKLEKAVTLNPNYSNALYSLGVVYDALGQRDKAIEEFTALQQLNPQNTDIPKILATLKAGKSILQSAVPPVETPPGSADNAVGSSQSTDKGGASNPATQKQATPPEK